MVQLLPCDIALNLSTVNQSSISRVMKIKTVSSPTRLLYAPLDRVSPM